MVDRRAHRAGLVQARGLARCKTLRARRLRSMLTLPKVKVKASKARDKANKDKA